MKILSNIAILNKFLLTTNELIESDVDEKVFGDKLNSDIKFYQSILTDYYFDKSFSRKFSSDTNLKAIFSCIKSYSKLLEKIINTERIYLKYNLDIVDINKKKEIIDNILISLKNLNERKVLLKKEEYIDEQEYSLLLNGIDTE